jgi:hypothetical protein
MRADPRTLLLVAMLAACRQQTTTPGDAGQTPCEHPNHPGIKACCGRPSERQGIDCVPWSLLDQPCSTAGQFSDVKRYVVCCSGLSGISTSQPLVEPAVDGGTCSTPFALDPTRVCARCGDGICGQGENRCNCPQDCP